MSKTQRDIAVFVGSLRAKSYNRMMAHVLAQIAPEDLNLEIVEIDDLPMYNPDLDGDDAPEPWLRLRKRLHQVEGVLFLTPEYNRSIPAVLKNAIDVGSRPYGDSSWDGKPGAIASLSPGKIGAFGANHHLRQCCVFLNIQMMQQPEVYLGGVAEMFDDQGNLIDDSAREFMSTFLQAFQEWVNTHLD